MASRTVRRALGSLLTASLSASLAGCDGCGSQKPYTPFGVASALPLLDPAAAKPTEPSASPAASIGFAVRQAELAPGAPSTWQGSGLHLDAPNGRRFGLVLPADFDADGALDALAWLVPATNEKNLAAGELWYFPSGAPARKLSDLPGFVPNSTECTLSTVLSQTGRHSATFDASASCKSQLIARAPSRAILVVLPSDEHPLLLTLRASAAAPEESLDFRVDSSDQDHDGRDDVRLTASLTGPGSSEPASADLLWFDRAAGPSRVASEPATSLLRSAAKLGPRAHGKRGADAAPHIAQVRRLLSSLCAEGGVARLFDEDGAPFRCGDLSELTDSLALSEVVTAIAQGDVLAAFSVLERDGWYFGKLSRAGRRAIERELLRAVSKFDAGAPLIARAEPAIPALPHYSPLWFENDGALLIRTATSVTRISLDRASEEPLPGDAGTPSWPLDLALPNGQRLLGAVHACDRSELLLNRSDAQHPLLPPLSTSLLAARPASCTGHGTGPQVTIAPLDFDENGLEALIAGARVVVAQPSKKPLGGLPAMGTPLSPDGRWLVSASPLGLLVIGEQKQLWRLQNSADSSRLTDCVVANEALAVACIDSGRAIVFGRPKPSASTTTTHEK